MKFLRTGVRIMLTFLIGVYVLLVVLATVLGPSYLSTAPGWIRSGDAGPARPGVQTFRIPCEFGGIAAAYLPNPEARYTLLYSHGNGEDMGDDLPILEEYRRAGFAVFAYDYNGYGASGGRPSEAAVYRDVEAAFDFLTGTLQVPPETSDCVWTFAGRGRGHSSGCQPSGCGTDCAGTVSLGFPGADAGTDRALGQIQ